MTITTAFVRAKGSITIPSAIRAVTHLEDGDPVVMSDE